LGAGQGAAPQGDQGAAHVVLAHPNLASDFGRVELLTAGDLAGLVELLDAVQRPPRRQTLLELGAAAVGVGALQRLELLRGWVAVTNWLDAQASQPPVGLLAGAQGVQPLAGDRAGGADLSRQLGRVERLAAGQLAGQVGVGDPVAHQPAALAVGAQHPHQVTGEPRRHAHFAG
jgi:hypothetical protein